MTINELYDRKLVTDAFSDIMPRMADLRRYAQECPNIVEFGVRTGNSTTAFLAGGATVRSYDLHPHIFDCPEDVAGRWTFVQKDTRDIVAFPECDALFIDTLHTKEQVEHELRYHRHVRKYILLHDWIEWGVRGEQGKQGILFAVIPFLEANPEWQVHEFLKDNWGLLVLKRV